MSCLCGLKVDRHEAKVQCKLCNQLSHAKCYKIKAAEMVFVKNNFKCNKCLNRRRSSVHEISLASSSNNKVVGSNSDDVLLLGHCPDSESTSHENGTSNNSNNDLSSPDIIIESAATQNSISNAHMDDNLIVKQNSASNSVIIGVTEPLSNVVGTNMIDDRVSTNTTSSDASPSVESRKLPSSTLPEAVALKTGFPCTESLSAAGQSSPTNCLNCAPSEVVIAIFNELSLLKQSNNNLAVLVSALREENVTLVKKVSELERTVGMLVNSSSSSQKYNKTNNDKIPADKSKAYKQKKSSSPAVVAANNNKVSTGSVPINSSSADTILVSDSNRVYDNNNIGHTHINNNNINNNSSGSASTDCINAMSLLSPNTSHLGGPASSVYLSSHDAVPSGSHTPIVSVRSLANKADSNHNAVLSYANTLANGVDVDVNAARVKTNQRRVIIGTSVESTQMLMPMKQNWHFINKYSLPGVIVCIDATHIRTVSPKKEQHLYGRSMGHRLS